MFHYGSNYDCNFIIKGLAAKFEEQFECLGGNTGKYITFTAPIKKENENGKTITYKIKFLTASDLWQAHYQLWLIILPMDSIKVNAKIAVWS